jgi:hypothetical protein
VYNTSQSLSATSTLCILIIRYFEIQTARPIWWWMLQNPFEIFGFHRISRRKETYVAMCQHLLLRPLHLSAATPSFIFVVVACREFLVFAKGECRDRLARITLRSVNSSAGLSGVVKRRSSCRRRWACCLTRRRPNTTPPLSLHVRTHPYVTWLI